MNNKINTNNPNFFFGYALAGILVSALGYLFTLIVDRLNGNIKAGYLLFSIIGSLCIGTMLLAIFMNRKQKADGDGQ